jgi:hypothetical protein
MTTHGSWSADEWATLFQAPVMAGMVVMLAGKSGPIQLTQELFAVGSAIAEADRTSQNSLVKEIAAAVKAGEKPSTSAAPAQEHRGGARPGGRPPASGCGAGGRAARPGRGGGVQALAGGCEREGCRRREGGRVPRLRRHSGDGGRTRRDGRRGRHPRRLPRGWRSIGCVVFQLASAPAFRAYLCLAA